MQDEVGARVKIRDAEVADAPAMGAFMVTTWLAAHRDHNPAELWERRRRDWTPEVSAAGWERCLREQDEGPELARAAYLLAVTGDESIVGLAAGAVLDADPAGTVGEVGSLYVDPKLRRSGLGRTLLSAVAARLAEQGIESLQIGVLTVNLEARRFYEALGGCVIAERLFDEEGTELPETVYGWPDITRLIGAETGHRAPHGPRSPAPPASG